MLLLLLRGRCLLVAKRMVEQLLASLYLVLGLLCFAIELKLKAVMAIAILCCCLCAGRGNE